MSKPRVEILVWGKNFIRIMGLGTKIHDMMIVLHKNVNMHKKSQNLWYAYQNMNEALKSKVKSSRIHK